VQTGCASHAQMVSLQLWEIAVEMVKFISREFVCCKPLAQAVVIVEIATVEVLIATVAVVAAAVIVAVAVEVVIHHMDLTAKLQILPCIYALLA
jgi:hypothetical protein